MESQRVGHRVTEWLGHLTEWPSSMHSIVQGEEFNYNAVSCPGGGHGNPLQDSCLENPMDRGACQAKVHKVTKSWTRLKWPSMRTCLKTDLSHLKERSGAEQALQNCPTLKLKAWAFILLHQPATGVGCLQEGAWPWASGRSKRALAESCQLLQS